MSSPIVPVILSGGAGTRLWPVSREALPKPFMKMGDGRSLLHRTLLRAQHLAVDSVWIVTNRDYYFLSRDELEDCALAQSGKVRYLLEPVPRNTAPAIALATLAVEQAHGEDALLLVLPADHLITDEAGFAACVQRAAALASQEGRLVTFGIAAKSPETAYGYIESGAPLAHGGFAVRRFVEKPSVERARKFLAAGNYSWNSGMFCFRARDMLAALEQVAPTLAQGARVAWAKSHVHAVGKDAIELDRASFTALESISIDYAVFEKAQSVAVVPGDFGWSDVGAWPEIAGQFPADAQQNRSSGPALFVDSAGCFVHADGRVVAALGLKDLVIIDTPDALLVMPKDRAQDVKKVVQAVRASGDDKHIFHRTVARPWGTYTVLQEGPQFKLKRIEVKPKRSLSLQMHHYRNEHWIVVSGTARVTADDKVFLLATNESTYIKAGVHHRLENPGSLPLVIIEVQSGQYVGEDDIVRFDDKYGRSENTQ
ncbi:MAG TPA: mannose-1-phosphate guanylyltransferase/mannose-6-phosphate isomerase [Burkholderiaceae bacterium]|nr:mannose-1-phosphate guanylyltransferase/mannose-6-phosphate isomerase [Burkholderiaceae bacterium]